MARVINANQPADADQRLYGMMQHLMAVYARQQAPEAGPRGVVEIQDALDDPGSSRQIKAGNVLSRRSLQSWLARHVRGRGERAGERD